jgi:DeoR/GlpR family transcriptional regulator of sugar metabolism
MASPTRFGRVRRQARDDRARRPRALLVDSSKFDVVQFERIGPLAYLDDLVTEAAPPRRLAAALRRDGVAQILAPR